MRLASSAGDSSRGIFPLLCLFISGVLVVCGAAWLQTQSAQASGNQDEAAAPTTSPAVFYMPMVYRQPSPTSTPTPTNTATPTSTPTATCTPTPTSFPPIQGVIYEAIPVDPYVPPERDDDLHADLNLDLRGFTPTSATLALVDYGGYTNGDNPRLRTLFHPYRVPVFTQAYRIYDWNWATNSRGGVITTWPVTFIWMQAAVAEVIYLPNRSQDIYQSRFRAMVLYATTNQITLSYSRGGSVATGFVVHIYNIWVEPSLVALYQQCNNAGRHSLPGIANDQPIGRAKEGGIGVAIRDVGSFMDPRSRKDWWQAW